VVQKNLKKFSTWDSLNKNGVTIILTTHYLHEAEEMCDRIGILNKGNLVALDTTKNLLKKIQTKIVKFLIDKKVFNEFSEAIQDRKNKGLTSDTTFVGINSADIKNYDQINNIFYFHDLNKYF